MISQGYHRRRSFSLVVLALTLTAPAAWAQVRADPGVVIGNRVAVRVNVTLADEETPYYPVRGLTLAFTRPAFDTVTGRTDEAGVVTVLLPPGNYTIAAPSPFPFKGTWYTWSVPVSVKPDMPAVEFNRANARVDRAGSRVVRAPPAARVQSGGDVAAADASRTSSDGTIRWLSMEVGGEGGVTRFGEDNGSDAGYGGSGAFVGGLGPVALALGYRYTRISYGGDVDPGSMRGGTVELRYHLRPGAAPVRPYLGALAGVGRWYDSESLTDESATMRMFGGTVGVQFGLATSVRLHLSATAAGTNIKVSSSSSSNGLFATGNLGLTFDIFSPAR
jgi:hypothetical protein